VYVATPKTRATQKGPKPQMDLYVAANSFECWILEQLEVDFSGGSDRAGENHHGASLAAIVIRAGRFDGRLYRTVPGRDVHSLHALSFIVRGDPSDTALVIYQVDAPVTGAALHAAGSLQIQPANRFSPFGLLPQCKKTGVG